MNNLVLHLFEGSILIVLSGWLTRLQHRTHKVYDLELRLVKAETQTESHGRGLDHLREAVDDIREHMVRREDIERLKS